jgi:hypothetical protein
MKTFIFLFLFCFSSLFSQNNKNYYSEISISKLNNLKQDCYSKIYSEYYNDIASNDDAPCADPLLGNQAGDNETVTFLFGHISPLFTSAARTRSLDSFRAASGNPRSM